jgi:transposase
MLQTVIGIDVSKQTLDVVMLHPRGNWHKVMDNCAHGYQQLQNWFNQQKVGAVHACLEATGQYGEPVAEFLYAQGHQVSVVNPARIKRYGESKLHRNKTDKADAALIAEFCSKEKPGLWTPSPPPQKHLRCLVRYLADLESMCRQEQNRLASGLQDEFVIHELETHIAYMQQRSGAIREAIQQHVETHTELNKQQGLLVSIPGIGKFTAARLIAELGDIFAFENAPQMAAFAGLNPKGKRSGSSVHRQTRISKEGRPFLRSILYMPGIVARQHNPIVRAFCDRLEAQKLPKMAITSAAMRKLLHIVYGVLKHNRPFDPNYLSAT